MVAFAIHAQGQTGRKPVRPTPALVIAIIGGCLLYQCPHWRGASGLGYFRAAFRKRLCHDKSAAVGYTHTRWAVSGA